jgi:prepilin peptidase CpaA
VSIILLLPFMGAGDVKLLTACALYTGEGGMLDFIVYVAVFGGIGSVLLLVLRAFTPYAFLKAGLGAEKIPRVLTDKEPVPYGVAIALAFLIMLWGGHMPGLVL